MSVRVRLTRVGSKKNPIWRVVVADQRSPRDGRFIEAIGRYNPQTDPSTIAIDEERLNHWLARGAQPTGTVKQLIKAQAASGGPAAADGAAEPEAEPPPAKAPEADSSEAEAPPAEAEPAEAPEADASEAEAPPAEAPEEAGEGPPESAPPGEPAPGAEGLVADPEAAAAERDA
jgi:small subunit ribosomal protein S16